MYTNDDLNKGVKKGIFTQDAVNEFKDYIIHEKNDEENFHLYTGFNDVFVVISSLLLLISAGMLADSINHQFAMIVTAIISWGLSEFFIIRRKMHVPGIMLLFSFVGSIFMLFYHTHEIEPINVVFTYVLALGATYAHWKRFAIPITIAMGAVISIVFFLVLLFDQVQILKTYIAFILFTMGILVFILAMYWDMKDRERTTSTSDVALWLHLLASPLIIHSLFLGIGIFENKIHLMAIIAILLSYLFLSTISLIIDRRALMISSLLYVIYALKSLFSQYGFDGYGLSMGGTIIGLGLLFLTTYWTILRAKVVHKLPQSIQDKVPKIKTPHQAS